MSRTPLPEIAGAWGYTHPGSVSGAYRRVEAAMQNSPRGPHGRNKLIRTLNN